jgi:cytoskeletal protein CcmA (bactofilin family)
VHSAPSQEPVQTVPTPQSVESFCHEGTHIGKSIVIKGEVSGSENVYLVGELEGCRANRRQRCGRPDGHINANVQARSIVVHGRVDGNLYGAKRVDLKKSARTFPPSKQGKGGHGRPEIARIWLLCLA